MRLYLIFAKNGSKISFIFYMLKLTSAIFSLQASFVPNGPREKAEVKFHSYFISSTYALNISETLHACAKHPLGIRGSSPSNISEIEPMQASFK